jgi:serine/threonine-protein kinase
VRTPAAHLGEAVTAPDELRPGLPADLRNVVMLCVEKEPARRFPDAGALDRALADCACAGGWTPETAADWWREHAAAGPGL